MEEVFWGIPNSDKILYILLLITEPEAVLGSFRKTFWKTPVSFVIPIWK